MAFFGKTKRGLFDPPEPVRTPGIGDDIIRHKAGLLGAGQPSEDENAPFWMGGKKFTTRDALASILAVIGDVAAQQSGGEPGAVGMLAGGRLSAIDMARKAQAAQQQRENEFQDFTRREAWKRDNIPPNNDTARDFDYIKGILGEEAARKFLQNKADPPMWRQGPDGQFYRMDTAPQTGGPKPGDIVDDPRLGGGAGNGVGGFPPRYRR